MAFYTIHIHWLKRSYEAQCLDGTLAAVPIVFFQDQHPLCLAATHLITEKRIGDSPYFRTAQKVDFWPTRLYLLLLYGDP